MDKSYTKFKSKIYYTKLTTTCLVLFLIININKISGQGSPIYNNTDVSFEVRAADLVSRMTLDEKIHQMQYMSPAIPRLGLKAYNWWSECLHGVANTTNVTVFPQAISMASTFNTALIHKEADVISSEARALYNESLKPGTKIKPQGLDYWAPNINIFRDPRWGRDRRRMEKTLSSHLR